MMMSRTSQSDPAGQELVEFALILPLLLLFLFGIIEFGIAVYRYNAMANIGREVARYGAINPDSVCRETNCECATPPPIAAHIEDEILPRWATAVPIDTLAITPCLTLGSFISSTIQVTVTYDHQFLTGPIIAAVGGSGQLTMRTVSTMQLERPVSAP
jgi:hypothetical protein